MLSAIQKDNENIIGVEDKVISKGEIPRSTRNDREGIFAGKKSFSLISPAETGP